MLHTSAGRNQAHATRGKYSGGEFKMDLGTISSSGVFQWVILPLLIFCSRILDVSIGTMRIIYVSRGMKAMATFCGFFEVLVWLVALTQLVQNLNNVVMFIAYAGGYATGNYVGILLEQKLAVGLVALRVITNGDASELMAQLKERDVGISSVAARGVAGAVRLVFLIIRRKEIDDVIRIIKHSNPQAFITIEDVKAVREEMPSAPRKLNFPWLRTLGKWK
jgi:uncharacterized protein YebE (UPF0316 family)